MFVNFGISGVERILRELRAALSRRGREMVLARHVARQGLGDELKNDVTALLLSCDVALRESELSDATAERLCKIQELANQIKTKLAVSIKIRRWPGWDREECKPLRQLDSALHLARLLAT